VSGHTKGPWCIKYSRSGYPYQIIAPNENDKAPGRVGKSITRWGAISLPSSDEAHANARLIAAAPDLLEALETIANTHANPVSVARAAIAKARGEG